MHVRTKIAHINGYGAMPAKAVNDEYDLPDVAAAPLIAAGIVEQFGVAPPVDNSIGSISATGVVGPIVPQIGRAMTLTISGTWLGSVQLLRSTDGGATKLPLTYGDGTEKARYSTNINAPVIEEWDAAATYWLSATMSSGTLSYRFV